MSAVDFSDARYTAAQVKAVGVSAVGRYLTGAGKAISGVELAGFLFGGVAVWLVFENTASDASEPPAVGAQYAQEATAALQALKLPTSTPVYFAADQDYPNPAAAVPYYQGLASIRPPETNGCYGEGALIDLLFSEGLVGYGWESESTSFPGSGVQSPNAAIWQKVDGAPLPETDNDVILKADFGQLPRPTPGPSPSSTGGSSMVCDVPGGGVLVVRPDGSVDAFEGAQFHGSLPGDNVKPAAPIVGICATSTGKGYWMVGADGGIFCFGDAQMYGPAPKYLAEWNLGAGRAIPVIGIVRGTAAGVAYTIVGDQLSGAAASLYGITSNGQYKS